MQLRVISGTLGGRAFQSPHGHKTHPMGEKIRGALFNTLGDITELTVLDAFAGSGAVSFEAISRGAKMALLVESDNAAIRTIKHNIEVLGLEDKAVVRRGNINGWSANHADSIFDIVICDPPYDAVLEQLIHKLSRHVAPNGVLVVSWPTHEPIPKIPNMDPLRHKTYGNATLAFYKKTG